MASVGYLVGSHVAYLSVSLPVLLESMAAVGIEPGRIFVTVNGAEEPHTLCDHGSHYYFQTGDLSCQFMPIVNNRLGEKHDITHWFYLNCTSKCGPRFKDLVESGYAENADATAAAVLLSLGRLGGVDGRVINDLAMYRYDYLMSSRGKINSISNISDGEIEGLLFAHAPIQAKYPNIGMDLIAARDVYHTGTPRITEHHAAVDWFRYKHNYGQLTPGAFLPRP